MRRVFISSEDGQAREQYSGRWEDPRSTAELDTGPEPIGAGYLEVVGAELKCDNANRVRVRLSKDGAQAGDLLGRLEIHLLAENLDVFLDPLVRDVLNLGEVGRRDRRLVREVEPELGRRDERSLLVNVVAEDFAKREVEDVGARVVVPKRPAARLVSNICKLATEDLKSGVARGRTSS